MNATATRKRWSDTEKKAVVVRFRNKDTTEAVTTFAERMGVAVPTLYQWKRLFEKSTWRSPRAAKPQRVLGRPAARPMLSLPPPEKLTESQRLQLENEILRGLIRLARAEGFASTVDLSLGIARG